LGSNGAPSVFCSEPLRFEARLAKLVWVCCPAFWIACCVGDSVCVTVCCGMPKVCPVDGSVQL
jgi:hypothetical protein